MGWEDIAKFAKEHQVKLDEPEAVEFEKKYGFRYEESWNLDKALAVFLLPRLAYLRDNFSAIPTYFCHFDAVTHKVLNEREASERWYQVLDTMVHGFKLYLEKEKYEWTIDDRVVWMDTLKYLHEHFECFWD